MGKYTRLGKNTLFVFVGNLGGKVLAILMLPLFTRWLSVADFGVTDMIMTYATLLFSLASLSICESAFIFPKGQDKKIQSEFFSSGLFFSCVVFLIIAIAILVLEQLVCIVTDNVLIKYRWHIYYVILAMYIENYFQQFTRSIDKIKVYSFAGIVQSICIIIFSFVFIPKYGVWGYVLTWATAYSLTGVYSFVLSGSYRYLSLSFIFKSRYWEMLKYSLPLIPNGMMFWLMNSMNRPVMEQYLGIDAVGIYALANKFPIILTTLFNIFLLSWQISVLEEFKKKEFEHFFNQVMQVVLLLLGVIFVFISLANKLIIALTATPLYYEAWKYISLLTFGSLVFALSAFVGANFLATKESKYFLYSSFGGAIIAIISNFIFIPLYSIYGAAISIILSSFIMLGLRLYYAGKHVKIRKVGRLVFALLLLLSISFSALIETHWRYVLILIEMGLFLLINMNALFNIKKMLIILKHK